jgi:hypothetical protein
LQQTAVEHLVHISLTQPTRERAITFSRLSIMYAKVFVASILACLPSIGFIYNSGSFRTIGVPGAVWTEAIGSMTLALWSVITLLTEAARILTLGIPLAL